ncbi:MAG: ABC transporter permease [Candidatus Limnocylindrales bacterium]
MIRRLLARPETTAILGVVLVWSFFAVYASGSGYLTIRGTTNYLDVASQIGILAIPVTLLLIAGDFDLSVGAMMGVTATIFGICLTTFGWPVLPAFAAALGFALAYGFFNGFLVIRTKLPSFLITLGSFFFLSGLSLAATRMITGRTEIGGLGSLTAGDPTVGLFAGDLGSGFNVSIIAWIALALLGSWVLTQTPFGNWIFACGGSRGAARETGVPVDRVRILLFMSTAAAAALVSVMTVLDVGQADPLIGYQKHFEALIVAVIGGSLLAGGYGSVIGSIFGALTIGIVYQGLFYARVNGNWYMVSLGAMLLIAVAVNDFVQRRARQWR